MERKATDLVDRGAGARTPLLVKYRRLCHRISSFVETQDGVPEPLQLGKCFLRHPGEGADTLVRHNREVSLDHLPSWRAQIQVVSAKQYLVVAKLLVLKTIDAWDSHLTPTFASRRRTLDCTLRFGPTNRCCGSKVNANGEIAGAGN